MPEKIISQSRLKELLNYDPSTGDFTWLVRTSNRIKVGDVAGSIAGNGYRYIMIDGSNYLSHRLVFLYMNGKVPVNCVDHKFGDRSDNRWDFIRQATNKQNSRNQKIGSRNKSGVIGVFLDENKNRWLASIWVNGKSKHIGCFIDFDDAVSARKLAELEHGYDKNHGRDCHVSHQD